jgi:hypothetical protein
MQPDASPEMVAYITWLQTEFITDILRSHRGQGYNREEKHYFFVLYFEKLVIPVLEELTFLNRNPLGNAFIKKNLSLRLPSGDMYSSKLYDFIFEQFKLTLKERQEERKTLMELSKAKRKMKEADEAFLKADNKGYKGVATNGDTSKMFMKQDGFGGKRTKKRKQKRSTNKKRRVHKKRGRMSKRR